MTGARRIVGGGGRLRRLRRALGRRIRGSAAPAESGPEPTSPPQLALAAVGASVTDLVLIMKHPRVALANELAGARPAATLHLVSSSKLPAAMLARLHDNVVYVHCPTTRSRLRHLGRNRQPQVIIERGLERSGERVETFRELFAWVAAGGRYVLGSTPAPDAAPSAVAEAARMSMLLTELETLARQPLPAEPSHAEELAASIDGIETVDGGVIITKRHSHQWKLRDSRANAVLGDRYHADWGEVITSKPATTYESAARATEHGSGRRSLRPEIRVPERWLRCYRGAICYPRKRVRLGDYWLPDSFRNSRMRVLGHRALNSASPIMARLPDADDPPVRTVDGAYYYLDSEYYSHFGHVLTDVVSTTWGWRFAKQREPSLRPLLSLPDDQPTVPDFQRRIFAALDVDPDDVEYLRPGTGVRVEELYGCTSDFDNPRFAAPELSQVWDRIRRGCMRPNVLDPPRLVFVSRRPRQIRTCLNTDEVERFFADLGFTVIFPETLDFADQIAIFHHARMVAGFAGSGLFNAMFAPDATLLVLAGSSYTALNEYLIKSVTGGDLHYFWAPSQIEHPADGWSWQAFRSNFVFDLERFGPEIADVVAQAGRG